MGFGAEAGGQGRGGGACFAGFAGNDWYTISPPRLRCRCSLQCTYTSISPSHGSGRLFFSLRPSGTPCQPLELTPSVKERKRRRGAEISPFDQLSYAWCYHFTRPRPASSSRFCSHPNTMCGSRFDRFAGRLARKPRWRTGMYVWAAAGRGCVCEIGNADLTAAASGCYMNQPASASRAVSGLSWQDVQAPLVGAGRKLWWRLVGWRGFFKGSGRTRQAGSNQNGKRNWWAGSPR